MSWDPSPSPVLGYKIVYKPVGKEAHLSSQEYVGKLFAYDSI